MVKRDPLARVDDDLERGHTYLAAQRLSSMIAADPHNLDLRARLADVHRRTGNFAEAGRWGYLTEEVTPAEIEAFERVHRSPRDQLAALRLHGDRPSGLGELAGARYALLTGGGARRGGRARLARTAPAAPPIPISVPAYVPPPAPDRSPARAPTRAPAPAPETPRAMAARFALTGLSLIVAGFTLVGMVTVYLWLF